MEAPNPLTLNALATTMVVINSEHDTSKLCYAFSVLDHINRWFVLSSTCQGYVNGDKESQSLNTKKCLILAGKWVVVDIYRYVFSHYGQFKTNSFPNDFAKVLI